jgi:hypothetical protein
MYIKTGLNFKIFTTSHIVKCPSRNTVRLYIVKEAEAAAAAAFYDYIPMHNSTRYYSSLGQV